MDSDGIGTVNSAALGLVRSADQASVVDRTDIDFGYIFAPPLGTIGDRVWHDLNHDGVQDPNEPGLENIVLTLKDANGAEKTTTTGTDGAYHFTGVPAGIYTVTATLPPGATATYPVTGLVGVNTSIVTVGIGANLETVDFGMLLYVAPPTSAIGGFVWEDVNGDGLTTGEESLGMQAQLLLKDFTGNVIDTVNTDASGHYTFPNRLQGNYTVVVANPPSPVLYMATRGLTASVSLNPPAASDNNNFGFKRLPPIPDDLFGSVGDRVWKDLDGDGVQDPGEPGLPNVTVKLYNALNVLVDTKVTDANGIYHFIDIVPGTYRVVATQPSSTYAPTWDRDGVGTPNQATVAVDTGDITDVDFGYWCPPRGSIGDRVWADTDSDGVQDSTESGLSGVLVTLYDANQNFVASDVTDCYGKYLFGNLLAGTYVVRVTPPANYGATYDVDGVATPNTSWVTITAGQDRRDVDFGYVYARGCGTIGNLVWKDTNRNGQVDYGESGIPGVTVTLLNSSLTVIATTTTDSAGQYQFRNLFAGTYNVRVTAPAQYIPTYDLDGVSTPNTTVVVLASNQSRSDVDFGYIPVSSTGDNNCEEPDPTPDQCYRDNDGHKCHRRDSYGRDCWYDAYGKECHKDSDGNDCYKDSYGREHHRDRNGNECYVKNNRYCHKDRQGRDCWYDDDGNECYKDSYGREHHIDRSGRECYLKDNRYCHKDSQGRDCTYDKDGRECWKDSYGRTCHKDDLGRDCWYNDKGDECHKDTSGNTCWKDKQGRDWKQHTDGRTCWRDQYGHDRYVDRDGCDDDSDRDHYYKHGHMCHKDRAGRDCWYDRSGRECHKDSRGNDCWFDEQNRECHYDSYGRECYYDQYGRECRKY